MQQRKPEFVTLGEAARILRVSRETIGRRVRVYQVPTFQGPDLREVLIRRTDLDRWRGVRPMPVATGEAVRHG